MPSRLPHRHRHHHPTRRHLRRTDRAGKQSTSSRASDVLARYRSHDQQSGEGGGPGRSGPGVAGLGAKSILVRGGCGDSVCLQAREAPVEGKKRPRESQGRVAVGCGPGS